MRNNPKAEKILKDCLRRIQPLLNHDSTYLFVLHWFKKGGAELETLHMIESLLALYPDIKIGLVTTLDVSSEWLKRLPKEVSILEFGKLAAALTPKRQEETLKRLLLEARPRVIHVVASRLGWDVYKNSSAELSRHSALLATSFGVEFNRKGAFSFAHSRLPYCKKNVRLLLSDNETHAEDLRNSVVFQNIRTLFMPVTQQYAKPRKISRKRLKILWAGRWDAQKRIDILYLIALFSPLHEFHVYGSLVGDESLPKFDLKLFEKLDNVVLRGPYDGFETLKLSDFDLFVYTSAWDGLPNVLIEAATKGLPIIAPDVGGVRELINTRTGFLVSDTIAVREYVKTIERVSHNPNEALKRARALQLLLRKRHSLHKFRRDYSAALEEAGLCR